LFRDLRRRRRSFAHDQEHGVLVLGAVPMYLLAIMRDEAAGGHRNGAVLGIELRTRADPPGPLQHHDIAVVGMEVRMTEMIALGSTCCRPCRSRASMGRRPPRPAASPPR